MSAELDRFREVVQQHYQCPPSTWTVEKKADRLWVIMQPDGGILDRYQTKSAADEAMAAGDSWGHRNWAKTSAWYEGAAPDLAALSAEQHAIVAEVRASLSAL